MDDPTAVLSRLLDAEVDRRLAWLATNADLWLADGERLPDELAALAERRLQSASPR